MKYKIVLMVCTILSLIVPSIGFSQGWNWVRRTDDEKGRPYILEFNVVDSTYCYAVGTQLTGARPFILRSRDKGLQWDTLLIDKTDLNFTDLRQISCVPDTNHIYLASDSSRIMRTTNAGKTWDIIRVDTNYRSLIGPYFVGVNFDKNGNGLLLRNEATYRTADYGSTWSKNKINPPDIQTPYINHTRMFGTDTIYAWCASQWSEVIKFAHSYDGGKTWITFSDCPQRMGVGPMTFVDKNHGWTVYEKGYSDVSDTGYDVIYNTTDGGRTWNPQLFAILFDDKTNTQPFGLNYITFYDTLNGIAANKFKILRSTDGGKYWRIEDRNMGNANPFMKAIGWVSSKIALLGNIKGSILRWNKDDVKTTDVVNDIGEQHTLLYPNPSKEYTTVTNSTILQTSLVTLTSIDGRQIEFEYNNTGNSIIVNTSTLPTGEYYLTILHHNKKEVIPLVVQR